jgi:thiol-disulfide isomerase/thioredoxin
MSNKRNTKKICKNAVNVLFVGILLLLILSPDAKAWFLKQLLSAGLFKAEIKKEAANAKSPAISFSYLDENGNIIPTNELKGKVVFINFWATWCPPCRAEMPSLNKLYNQFKDDNRIVFLFLNEDDNSDKAKAFLKNKDYSFPITKRIGNIPGEIFSGTLPTTVVLNKEGKIAMKHEGIAGYNNKSFNEQLKSLL